MSAAPSSLAQELRPGIIERRARLEAAASSIPAGYLNDLLAEIDGALKRIDQGSYGVCEVCHEAIEADCLCRNPLERFCLDHLSSQELKAHAQDLELATRIQAQLLPARDIVTESWETHYRYEPAGVVSGDYCEIAASGDSLFFALGDVAGKGVAASLLMTHLSAIFRSLRSLQLPFTELISRANRLFCESTPATHYATMVAGQTTARGANLCNAGHCKPLLLRPHGTERIDSTGLPLGLFCDGRQGFREIRIEPGDILILYSDGITEAQDAGGNPYEEDRLIRALRRHAKESAQAMAEGVLRDVSQFRGEGPQQDDMTLLIIRRRG
jgi:sigma-B regulation protein RsbU (phosphoserine phosphatase)